MKDIKKLCPECQTGLDSLKLDKHSPICPFLYLHSGDKCSMFVKVKAKQGIEPRRQE